MSKGNAKFFGFVPLAVIPNPESDQRSDCQFATLTRSTQSPWVSSREGRTRGPDRLVRIIAQVTAQQYVRMGKVYP